jgi:putative membrane protein
VLQANERTLLAWIRTGLALMAFGFMIARVSVWLQGAPSTAGARVIGVAFVVLGTVSNVVAAARYRKVRRSILEGRAVVPGNGVVLSVTLGLTLLGAMLVAYLVV